MRVAMKYGSGELALEVPDALVGERRAFRGEPDGAPGGAGAAAADALAGLDELRAAGLRGEAAGRRVALFVNDGTREPWHERLLPGLLELLADARELRLFVCTGTHAPDLPETVRGARRLTEPLAGYRPPSEVHVHDARRGEHVRAGRTSRGTPIELDARAAGCELFLAVADMKNHYFAGYSNAVKSYVPGIASAETARCNHSLALEDDAAFGRHPWHPDPARRTNPVAEDMVEGMELFLAGRPSRALALVAGGGRVRWSGGGETREVSARGMLEVDRTAGLELEPARFLVVSPGGRPHDESLYTAQRALELTQAAVRPGGEVLFLAECANGIGPESARENFFEPLSAPLATLRAPRREDYVLYAHKPVKLARYLTRLARVHLVSRLPGEAVRRIHLEPAEEAQAVVDAWARAAGPQDRIHFLDDASRFAVRTKCP